MSDIHSTALELRRHTSMTGARFDEVLAAHDAQVRADERERIAAAIEGRLRRYETCGPSAVAMTSTVLAAFDTAARIARAEPTDSEGGR